MTVLGLCCCASFSLTVASGGYSLIAVLRRLIVVASPIVEHGSRAHGLQRLCLQGCRAQAQQVWCMGFVTPQHVRSSQIRD